jgi:hypothetical protein
MAAVALVGTLDTKGRNTVHTHTLTHASPEGKYPPS